MQSLQISDRNRLTRPVALGPVTQLTKAIFFDFLIWDFLLWGIDVCKRAPGACDDDGEPIGGVDE